MSHPPPRTLGFFPSTASLSPSLLRPLRLDWILSIATKRLSVSEVAILSDLPPCTDDNQQTLTTTATQSHEGSVRTVRLQITTTRGQFVAVSCLS
ncbi:hypothetical protein FA13DRAFT_59939 [Coprinellus micaceus]|uniref:Uncharacterized protein n=1 Tax=Coprinellus micaceus TaxID=71717 RepID=A0A4Y7U2E2_COPMI|nr:hypothetical protein FA13DRAFT_59939 [Coprinellus micaceus]